MVLLLKFLFAVLEIRCLPKFRESTSLRTLWNVFSDLDCVNADV